MGLLKIVHFARQVFKGAPVELNDIRADFVIFRHRVKFSFTLLDVRKDLVPQ